MSNYTKQISWSGKDALSDSDSEKVISGGDFDTEFSAVQTAINSKIDDIVDDTTPQLGGDLDFQTHKATSFTSTGIDDNATGTKLTISDTTITGVGAFTSTSIDATKLSGDLPAIDGASLTGFTDAQMPAGSVVQVVSSTNTTHYSTTSSSVQQGPQTGTLTLKNTSNKVLVTVTFIVRMTKTGGGAQGGRYAIYRGSIASGTKLTAGSEPQHYFNDPGTESYILTTLTYYDTPGANTTYSLGYYKHPAGTTAEIHGGFFTTHFTMQEVSV